MRPRNGLLVGLAVVAAALTVFVALSPAIRLAYSNLGLHVALDTAEGLAALLLAALAVGRFRASRARRDLFLALAFSAAAAGNLFLSVFASITLEQRSSGVAVWGALALRSTSAVLLAVAAVSSGRVRARPRAIAAACAVGIGCTVAFAFIANEVLDSVVDPALSLSRSSRPELAGDPFVAWVQLMMTAVSALAAVGFLRGRDERDELVFWLGGGAMLAAFARVNYFLFPSLYSPWVYAGDVLRFGAYALYVIGAQREIAGYLRARARVVALEERRRFARDLHDGLAQELSFLRSQLASDGLIDGAMRAHLAAAAERAHTESRRLVEAFGEVARPGLRETITTAAEEVARRSGARVEVEVDETLPISEAARVELLRIVREATSNAVRHGGAALVRVRLVRAGDGVRLTVSDEGRGFDADLVHAGFGLRSMAERASTLGGDLTVQSTDGAGTSIEVLLPGT